MPVEKIGPAFPIFPVDRTHDTFGYKCRSCSRFILRSQDSYDSGGCIPAGDIGFRRHADQHFGARPSDCGTGVGLNQSLAGVEQIAFVTQQFLQLPAIKALHSRQQSDDLLAVDGSLFQSQGIRQGGVESGMQGG